MSRLPGDVPDSLWCPLCSNREAMPGESFCDQCRLLRPLYLDVAPGGAGETTDLAGAPGMKGVRSGWSAMEYVLIAMLLAGAAALLVSGV